MSDGKSDWTQRQLWTLIEAACLLAGAQPVPAKSFNKDLKTGGQAARIYNDLKDAIDLRQLTFTETRDGYIQGRRVVPADVITWAICREYSIPQELTQHQARPEEVGSAQTKARILELLQQERQAGRGKGASARVAEQLKCTRQWVEQVDKATRRSKRHSDPSTWPPRK